MMVWNNGNALRSFRFPLLFATILCCTTLLQVAIVTAYRVGDVVETAMYTREFPVDLLMANRPLFGVRRTVKIPRTVQRFSLAFEEGGMHSLPYLDGQMLERLTVSFIYSRSGDGRIHSVTYEAHRSKNGRAINAKVPIDVEFEWIEEEAVNLDAGMSVIFMATLVASIVFLIQLCSVGDNNNTAQGGAGGSGNDDAYRNTKKNPNTTTVGPAASVSLGYGSGSSHQRGKYSYE